MKDFVMEDHLECGCVGSVRLKGDNLLEDNNNDGSRRQFFNFFLGLTLGLYIKSKSILGSGRSSRSANLCSFVRSYVQFKFV